MAKIITYEDWIAYLRSLAAGHKLLNPEHAADGHFYEFEEDFAGNNILYPAMVSIPPRHSLQDAISDNVMKNYAPEFWIMKSVSKGDHAGRRAAVDLCEAIGLELIRKMKSDNADYSLTTDRKIQDFKLSSVKWDQLGPVRNDNCFGQAFELTFQNAISMQVDATKWW